MTISKEKFGKYEGKWVAMKKSDETVLASGKDIVDVSKKLKMKSYKGLVFFYVIPFKLSLAPTLQLNEV